MNGQDIKDQRQMRIIFMGTPDFALPSLKILLDNGYEIPLVVTVPDKPRGRGLVLSSSPVKLLAQKHHLAVLQPEKMKDPNLVQTLENLAPDLIVVVAFRILPPEVFRVPTLGAVNLHASLLPKYRGAAPINWAIIRGEKETGVTTFFLKEAVDTGSVILQARLPVGPDETAGELHDRLADVGAEVVLHTVRLIASGKAQPHSQDESLVTGAPKIHKDDCRINWDSGAPQVHNFIRGLSPKPAAFTFHKGTLLKVYRSRVLTGGEEGRPGEVAAIEGRLVVKAREGSIELLEIQQEGKKKLPAPEFLRGYCLKPGEVLS